MYNGKYIAENQNKGNNQRHPNNPYSSRIAAHRRRQRQKRRLILCGLAVVVIILAVVSIFIFKPKDNVKAPSLPDVVLGTWVYDQYTKYEFDGYGKGCMCLENLHYEYAYEIDGNTLSMDFENEAVHDCSYTFSVNDNTLTIVGGEGTTGGTYTLTKAE